MRRLVQVLALLISLSVPLQAAGAPPSSVTGIKAVLADGRIRVSWEALPGEDIAYFRVYYSRKSILANSGEYDDFEVTSGDRTSYTLSAFPPGDTLYLSVLAVNRAGEESTYFAEEAQVTTSPAAAGAPPPGSNPIPAPQPSPPAAAPPPSTGGFAPLPSTVEVLSAVALSATGVTVTFSQPVTVAPTDAVGAFTVEDGSGNTLALRRLVFRGNEVLLHTEPQRPDVPYVVRVAPSIHGKETDGSQSVALLDTMRNTALFVGWNGEWNGEGAQSDGDPSAFPDASATPPDPSGLRLRAEPTDDGYAVTAEWTLDDAAGISGVDVLQSTDDGRSYSAAQSLSAGARSVRFSGVPSGIFTVLVRTTTEDGRASPGTAASIELPAIEIPQGPLNQSGPAAALAFVGVGAAFGYWKMRRKMRR